MFTNILFALGIIVSIFKNLNSDCLTKYTVDTTFAVSIDLLSADTAHNALCYNYPHSHPIRAHFRS